MFILSHGHFTSWLLLVFNMETVWTVLTHLIFLHLVKGSITNVARNKPASMSSQITGFNPARAVDGDTTAVYPGRIISTATGQSFAWWKVDLEREVQNATVEIYFRTDYIRRRNGVQIYTSTTSFSSYPEGQMCYTVTGDRSGSDIDDVVSVTCPGRWRYLLIYTNTDNDRQGPILDFGEVMVLVCSSGTYGSRCSQLCSDRHCLNSSASCNATSGSCDGDCRSGWKGTDCTQVCRTGMYGVNCMESCSSRHCVTPSSECDRQTGQCIGGCQEGWRGVDCARECPAGKFGVNCTSCNTRHCQGDSDCHADGRCSQGCQDGWTLTTCTQACPSGSYGSGCNKMCGHCIGDNICNHVTGNCPGDCQDGWEGRQCQQVCPPGKYGMNCVQNCGQCNRTCDVVDGHCPAGCLHGYCGQQCKNKLAGGVPVTTVVGAVVGSVLVVVLVGVGVLLCLITQGRLQWVKVTNKDKSNQNTGDNTQMRNLGQEHVRGAEQAHSSYVYNNDYAELNAEAQTGNKDYDVIQQKHYQNV